MSKKLGITKEKIIEIDATPDMEKYKPIAILEAKEFNKLVTTLENMREPWLALKFSDSLFLLWRDFVFLHLLPNETDKKTTEQ